MEAMFVEQRTPSSASFIIKCVLSFLTYSLIAGSLLNRVVAVEPFGYGLSDKTETERTTENIVSEIHEALQALDIDRYILMGHSIAGIYGLEYVNKYPSEVIAFAGIDSSVPDQGGMETEIPVKTFEFLKKSGLLRLVQKISGDP